MFIPIFRNILSVPAENFTRVRFFISPPSALYLIPGLPFFSAKYCRITIIALSVFTLLGQLSTQVRHKRQKLTTSSTSALGLTTPCIMPRAILFLPRALDDSISFTPNRGHTVKQVPHRSHWLTISSTSLKYCCISVFFISSSPLPDFSWIEYAIRIKNLLDHFQCIDPRLT